MYRNILARIFGKRNTKIQPATLFDWLDYSAQIGYLPPALQGVQW